MTRPSSSWRRSATRTRTSWTRSAREAAPSTRSTRSGSAWRPRRWSSRAGGEQGAARLPRVDPGEAGDRKEDRPEGGGVRLHQEELRQGHRGHADGSRGRDQGQGRSSSHEEEARLRRCRPRSCPRARQRCQRQINLIQGNIRSVQQRFEEESRAKAVANDNLISADRRANANQNALEEARTLLEQADRNRRMIEQELADTNESLSDQTCTNQAISGAKMKCDEEKAQRAMVDAARLADELRQEQDVAMALERDKKLLEAQVKDAQNRLDEAEQNALKGGKKAMAKMETRIRELESEMDAENRRCTDAQKNLRRSERHIKELTYQQDEDRKNHERTQGLIDQLQGKIKSYKKQIEEAEEIAALNLAKYRQVQTNLAGSTERADLNEQALAKTRARGRSASIGPM